MYCVNAAWSLWPLLKLAYLGRSMEGYVLLEHEMPKNAQVTTRSKV